MKINKKLLSKISVFYFIMLLLFIILEIERIIDLTFIGDVGFMVLHMLLMLLIIPCSDGLYYFLVDLLYR